MATETDIPDSVSSKKDEREDNTLLSEVPEEKVAELSCNKVKQLESKPNLPLETISYVAETVNTQPETDIETERVSRGDIETNEGGTFLQELSVPMVTTDKNSNILESCEATKTEDQAERKTTEIEPFKEGKLNDDEVEVVIKEASANEHQPNARDHMKESQTEVEGRGVSKVVEEAISAQNEGSIVPVLGLTKGPNKDGESIEICNKDESTGDSSNTKREAPYEEDLQGRNYNGERKETKFVKTGDSIEEDAKEIKPSVEIQERIEQQVLLRATTTNACILTQTESQEETAKNEEDATENDDDRKEKSGSPSEKEVCEETGPEKAESEEGVKLSDKSSMKLNEKVIATFSKDLDQEKEQELNMSEVDQGKDDVTCSQDEFSVEDLQGRNYDGASNEPEYVKPKESIEEDTKEISSSVKIKGKLEQQDVASQEELQGKNYNSEVMEPEFDKPRESIEEDTEEISSSVETNDKMEQDGLLHTVITEACISTQIDFLEETTENEEKNEEETLDSDDGRNQKSVSPSTKEVCEEGGLEKAESKEGVELSDNADTKLNEKSISSLTNDEDQGKEELNMPKKYQGEDELTCSHDVAPVEDLEEKNCNGESKEPEFVKTRESTEKDTEEIRSSVETQEKLKEQGLVPAITTDACISTQSESQDETTENEEKNEEEAIESIDESIDGRKEKSIIPPVEVCEDTGPEKAESEEGVELSDNSTVKLNQQAIATVRTDEDQEKEEEINMSEKGQVEDDVTGSQDAASEEELQGTNNDGEHKEPDFVKTTESIEDDTEEIRPIAETQEKIQEQRLMHSITTDACISTQTESHYVTTENEEKNEDNDGGRKEEYIIHPVTEVREDTGPEKVESEEEVKLSDKSTVKLKKQVITTLSKDEDQEKEQEINMSEKGQGEDDVTGSQDAASEEELHGKNYDGEYKEPDFIKTTESIEDDPEVIRPSVETQEKIKEQGLTQAITTDACISTQKESHDKATENEEKNEEEAIESNDGRKEKSIIPPVKEECEDTGPEKAKSEAAVKLSDNSIVKLNQQEIATLTKDDDQEQEQEVNMSNKGQGEDDVRGSQDAASEKGLQGKNYDGEHKEPDFVKSTESIEYDTEEIRPGVETQEKIEEKGLMHAITTDACISTQTESQEEATENEEKNEEDAIKGDEGQTKNSIIPPEKKVCEDTGSGKAEFGEGVKISDNSTVINNQAIDILSKDKDQEKEQEVNLSEKDQGEDSITRSQDAVSREDLLEKNDHDEGNDREFVKTRESTVEGTEEIKSSVETKEKTLHQGLQHAITTDVCILTQTEHEEETSKNEKKKDEKVIESDAGWMKKSESPSIKETHDEIGLGNTESKEGVKLSVSFSMTLEEKENVSKDEDRENEQELNISEKDQGEDEVTSSQNTIHEDIKETTDQHVTIVANFEEQGLKGRPTEILKEEPEDKSIHVQEMSLELRQPKEQNIDEIHVCLTKTISEKTEDEITSKDEDLSHNSLDHKNDNSTKEEKCFRDGRTREIEISTVEHELAEEQNDDLDEASKEKSTDLKETKAVEAQEDVMFSSSLGTSIEGVLNLGKSEAESENLPIEDLEYVSDVQIPGEVPKSEGPNTKEECLISATATYTDEEHRTVTKEISSDQKTEWTREIKQVGEHPSIVCLDAIPIEELGRYSEKENKAGEGRPVEDLYQDSIVDQTVGQSKEAEALTERDLEPYGEPKLAYESVSEDHFSETTQQPEKSDITTENNATQLEHVSDEDSRYEKSSMEEDVTPQNQLNSTQDHDEMIKDVILTEGVPLEMLKEKGRSDLKEQIVEEDDYSTESQMTSESNQKDITNEISYSDPIHVNPEVTELGIDSQRGLEDLQAAEGISCESKASSTTESLKKDMKEGSGQTISILEEIKDDCVDEAPKDEIIPDVEDATALEPQVNLSNIETTNFHSESEELPIKALKTVCDVQSPELTANSEDSKVKDECLVLATEYPDEDNGDEEHETIANEISAAEELGRSSEHENITGEGRSVMDPYQDTVADRITSKSCPRNTKEENVKQAPTESDEAKWSDTNTEAKALTKESLETHGELKPTSKSVIEGQTNETAPQPQKSDIATENDVKCQTLESESEHIHEKASKDGKRDVEEDGILTPENQINSTQDRNETTNDVILTEEVEDAPVEVQKENGINESKKETVKEDSCSTELQKTTNQKETTNEKISCLDSVTVGDYEVTEPREYSQNGHEDLNSSEDLTNKLKILSTTEESTTNMKEGIEQPATIIRDANKNSVNEEPMKERIPALEDATMLEPQSNLPNIESLYPPSESETLPIEALESCFNVQRHEKVPNSENSQEKEERLVLAPAGYRDGDNLDEEHENIVDQISNEEKREQTTYSEQVVENPSIVCLDEVLIEKEPGSKHEQITNEGRPIENACQESIADVRRSEGCPQETKEENVNQSPRKSDEVKWSDTKTEAKALTEENLEPYGDLRPPSESMIEDQVSETLQPEQSDITSGNNDKYQRTESELENMNENDVIDGKKDKEADVTLSPEIPINSTQDSNETMKNNSLNEIVEVKIENEKGRNEVKLQDSEQDGCPTELLNTSESNQKELANEMLYSKPIAVGDTEDTEVRAEREIELENLQAAEDLSSLSKASSTVEASKTEMNEGTSETVSIIGELQSGSIDEAPKNEIIPAREDAKAIDSQVNLPEIESTDPSSDGQDSMKLEESMPQSMQETIIEKGLFVSHLTDGAILAEAIENREGEPNLEFEKSEKHNELISEIQTPEAVLKTEMKEEHLEAVNNTYETLGHGLSSEKLLDELKEIDAKEHIEVIARGEEKAIEESYRDATAEVKIHESLSQKEKKLAAMVTREELTSSMDEDQTNELVLETDKTKVHNSSINNSKQDLDSIDEEFVNVSKDQKIIKEGRQRNFGVEDKDAKSRNKVVEDVIVNEVVVEIDKAEESRSIKDDTSMESSCMQNQLTSATDEVCQIKGFNSSPNEILEPKGSITATKDLELTDQNLNLKAETLTIIEGPTEDMKRNTEKTAGITTSEFTRLGKMVTKENVIKADADKEKETVRKSDADETRTAKFTSYSISNSVEQYIEVRAEKSRGPGDMHKLEEEMNEVFEITTGGAEIITVGREVPAILTENPQESSREMLPEKHGPEITTTFEKIEDESTNKDETLANMCLEETLSVSTEEVAWLSKEKIGEFQVSTLSSEIAEGKQNGAGEMLNKEREVVQRQEKIGNIKFVDPPSDVEISEQGEVMHCVPQEPSEDILLSQNDKKIEDSLILSSEEKEILQGEEDITFKEAPIIDVQIQGKGLDHMTKATSADATSNAESAEIERLKIKDATLESISQDNQSGQKKEADENTENEISSEKVPKQTITHMEVSNESLVAPAAKEKERSYRPEDNLREQQSSGERTYQELEAAKEPIQTEELSEKVEKTDTIDIQEGTMAKGSLHEEKTKERTKIIEATVKLHHKETHDKTNSEGPTTDAANPIEDKCSFLPSVTYGKADKAGYNKDPDNKAEEVYEVEKEILKEGVHLESTSDRSKITKEVSSMKQESFDLNLTRERSVELDPLVTHGTAATEGLEISHKYVTDDLIKVSEIQLEIQKHDDSAHTVDKLLQNKAHQNESMKSKHLTGNIDPSDKQGDPTAKSLNAAAEDLKATKASGTEPQCSIEVFKEENKMSDGKELSDTSKPGKILFTDILYESNKGSSQVAEQLVEEREPAQKKDQQVEKEEINDSRVKTDEENEEEDNEKMGSFSDTPVMVEASTDMEVKAHKKSHNILSGVGSKVKHSIAKVKKAITGKSSHPKQKDEVIT